MSSPGTHHHYYVIIIHLTIIKQQQEREAEIEERDTTKQKTRDIQHKGGGERQEATRKDHNHLTLQIPKAG